MRKLCQASVRPNTFLNLNSNCKKIPLSSPLTFAPLLSFIPPNVCPFAQLPPLTDSLTPPPPPPEQPPYHLPEPTPPTPLEPPSHLNPHYQTVNQTLLGGVGVVLNGQRLGGIMEGGLVHLQLYPPKVSNTLTKLLKGTKFSFWLT